MITLAHGGRGTRRQVQLSISALYLSVMAARQLGSAIAACELAGNEEASVEEPTVKPYRRMGGGNDPV